MNTVFKTELFSLFKELDGSLRLIANHSYRIKMITNQRDIDRAHALVSWAIETNNPTPHFNMWADHELG